MKILKLMGVKMKNRFFAGDKKIVTLHGLFDFIGTILMVDDKSIIYDGHFI